MDSAISHVLEVTVISGEDLFVTRWKPVKRNAFVVIQIDEDASGSQRTIMDKKGGSYPLWMEKFVMNFPMHARYVRVEVYCKTALGDNFVGIANIPKSDFLGEYVPIGYLHFLSYRLRDRNGERNGIINVSIRVQTDGEKAGFISGFSNPSSLGMPVDGKVSSTPIVMGGPKQNTFHHCS